MFRDNYWWSYSQHHLLVRKLTDASNVLITNDAKAPSVIVPWDARRSPKQNVENERVVNTLGHPSCDPGSFELNVVSSSGSTRSGCPRVELAVGFAAIFFQTKGE
jgi:hypothetical protein